MSMDKFGRTRRNNGAFGTNQQVLIPNNLLRTDGTNAMQANLDLSNNEIVNVGVIQGDDVLVKSDPKSSDSIVPKYMLDSTNSTIDSLFDKKNLPMNLDSAQITTTSEYGGSGSYGSIQNLTDDDPTSQWIINKDDINTYVNVTIELSEATRIHRCDLLPRNGKQQTTHIITHCYLEGSNDNNSFTKIFESNEIINITRSYNFNVTLPYKYFKFTCAGNLQFGLSELKLYEAILKHIVLPPLSQIALNNDNLMYIKRLSHIDIKETNISASSEFIRFPNWNALVKHAVDNDPDTTWIVNAPGSTATHNSYIDIDLEQPRSLYKMTMSPRNTATNSADHVSKFILSGSNDQTNYTKILEKAKKIITDETIEFPITDPYRYIKLEMEGKYFYGISDLKLYEATLSSGTKIDPNGHLTTSSDGLRLSSKYIETDEVKTKLINVNTVSADIVNAVGLRIEAGTANEMRILNRQITNVIAPLKDDEVANKVYVDDKNKLMKSYVDNLYKRIMLSYAGNNISINDKLDLIPIYNTLGAYHQGILTFNYNGVVRYMINAKRNDISSDITLRVTYTQNRLVTNYMEIKMKKNEYQHNAMNLINVRKEGILSIISDSAIPDIVVLMEILQIT